MCCGLGCWLGSESNFGIFSLLSLQDKKKAKTKELRIKMIFFAMASGVFYFNTFVQSYLKVFRFRDTVLMYEA
jgi:hypothetical protein